MIKEIHFTNMKGQTGGQELTGKDIFIGRNGSGKTTRVQALGLSLLGYVPGNGKTAAETFKLATGQEMTAGLVLDNNFRFSRTFTRSVSRDKKTGVEKVSISENVDIAPGKGEKNDTQKKARILAEVGSFPVMLDFNEFLTLSDAKRRDFIYSLSPISSEAWTKECIESHLMAYLVTEGMDKDYAEVAMGVIREAMEQFPASYAVSDGLQAMLDWTVRQLSFWKSKQKDAQGAVRQMADLKNELVESDRHVNEDKADMEKFQEDLINAEKTLARDQERARLQEQRIARIAEIKEKLQIIKTSETVEAPNYELAIKELEAKKVVAPDATEEWKEEWKAAMAAEKAQDVDTDAILEKITALKQERKAAQTHIASLEMALGKVAELEGICIIHRDIRCPKDFAGFDKFIEIEKSRMNSIEAAITADIAKEEAALAACKQKMQDLVAASRALQAKGAVAEKHNNQVDREINDLHREKNAFDGAELRRIDQINLLQEELDRLSNQPVEEFNALSLLVKQIAGLRIRIGEMKTALVEKEKAKQTLLLMQQSLSDTRSAEHKASAFADLAKELGPKGIQGELVKSILFPLVSDISCALSAIGFSNEPYFDTESDTGQEIFQFGWINEKRQKVNFDALSTGQQTIFLAAMMSVIIRRAQPPLRALILDNVNHLDAINFQLMVDGIGKLSGSLDNIILAGAVQFPFEAEGWGVWNLDPVVDVGYEAVAANG